MCIDMMLIRTFLIGSWDVNIFAPDVVLKRTTDLMLSIIIISR